jgi:mono/diheme cytochrome c family protein
MRHRIFRTTLVVLAAGAVFGDGAALAASAEKGKAAFMKYGCWQCHGTQGQGSVASNGKVLAPDPLPYESFSAFVRLTNGAMPPYSEHVLPNDDLADIHAYLSSIPKPSDHTSIPLLNQ